MPSATMGTAGRAKWLSAAALVTVIVVVAGLLVGRATRVAWAAPTVRTWSGLGTTDHWTDPLNWIGGVAPSPGDSLVFPSQASQTITTNDYTAGTAFGSVTIAGAYSTTGNRLTLSGGIDCTTNQSTSFPAVTLAGDMTIKVESSSGSLGVTHIDVGSQVLTVDTAGEMAVLGIGGTSAG